VCVRACACACACACFEDNTQRTQVARLVEELKPKSVLISVSRSVSALSSRVSRNDGGGRVTAEFVSEVKAKFVAGLSGRTER
jgi:hypothetical protein